MSWCNYYYNPSTMQFLEDDYKSNANLDNCVRCAIKKDFKNNCLKKWSIDENSDLFKNIYDDYYSQEMTFYTKLENETDIILRNIMIKHNIKDLIIDIN